MILMFSRGFKDIAIKQRNSRSFQALKINFKIHGDLRKSRTPGIPAGISKLYPYSLQSYWTSKFGKIIPHAIFAQKWALSCITKIILTEKLFGVGNSNVGFVHLDNWATH